MARIVLTDAYVKLNNVDLSDHIASVEIAQSFDAVETTAFGDSGRTRTGGLEDSSITLSFHQDFASGSVDATIAPLVGGTAAFERQRVDVGPDGAFDSHSLGLGMEETEVEPGVVGREDVAVADGPEALEGLAQRHAVADLLAGDAVDVLGTVHVVRG